MIIALTGSAGAGKSTLAHALVRDHGFVRVRFAGPLKAMLRALGLNEAQVDGDAKETSSDLLCGRTPRWAMQTLGTEWGRDCIGADLWVNATMRQIDTLIAAHRDVVVDDLRFDNEARALAKRDTMIVQVRRGDSPLTPTHASEVGIADTWVAARIQNDGTIDDAVRTLSNICEATRARGRHGP